MKNIANEFAIASYRVQSRFTQDYCTILSCTRCFVIWEWNFYVSMGLPWVCFLAGFYLCSFWAGEFHMASKICQRAIGCFVVIGEQDVRMLSVFSFLLCSVSYLRIYLSTVFSMNCLRFAQSPCTCVHTRNNTVRVIFELVTEILHQFSNAASSDRYTSTPSTLDQ